MSKSSKVSHCENPKCDLCNEGQQGNDKSRCNDCGRKMKDGAAPIHQKKVTSEKNSGNYFNRPPHQTSVGLSATG